MPFHKIGSPTAHLVADGERLFEGRAEQLLLCALAREREAQLAARGRRIGGGRGAAPRALRHRRGRRRRCHRRPLEGGLLVAKAGAVGERALSAEVADGVARYGRVHQRVA